MNKLADNIAKVLSVVLYPLFVPTYGVGLFCYAYSVQVQPLTTAWMIVAIIGTFLLTCFIPISAIWVLMRRGSVSDMHIENAHERTIPYVYALLGFGFWCWLMIQIIHAPLYISTVSVGATIAIAGVLLINRWWKISAHLTGLGGLVGGLMSYCLGIGAIPTWGTMVLWFGMSWVLMWARLRLNAHTSAQVSAGWLWGMSCTFLPYWIISLL